MNGVRDRQTNYNTDMCKAKCPTFFEEGRNDIFSVFELAVINTSGYQNNERLSACSASLGIQKEDGQ